MALPFNPFFFLLFPLMALYFADGEDELPSNCAKGFFCGPNIGYLEFPFAKYTQADCGLVAVNCDTTPPIVQLETGGDWYRLVGKSLDSNTIIVEDSKLQELLDSRNCSILYYTFQLPNSSIITFRQFEEQTFLISYNNQADAEDICNYGRYNINCTTDRYSLHTDVYSLYYKRPSTTEDPNCVDLPSLTYEDSAPFTIESSLNSRLTAQVKLDISVLDACNGCYSRGGKCTTDSNNEFRCAKGNTRKRKLKLVLVAGGAAVVLIFMFILLLIFINKKFSFSSCINPSTEIKNYQDAPEFLNGHGPLTLIRFSYSEVKKITTSFKNELGQGGFGSVYKGKLHNGRLVAVKVLKELRAGGEDFINEVASISRTSHVNIVTLIGFCIEGRKRALVYEFMPNGSLEKFIYNNNPLTGRQLGWNMLYKISIGIARGLEYLHRGCNTRILHLDIKPHNILLDEDFSPKISDFGLAKLCTKKESIVSIFGARGTIGYIAPELVCKNIGGVSHKSDVYSYGMMVLEMVGGRRNIDVVVSRNSKIYFPHWIYSRLVLEDELGLDGVMNEEENECARKMVIVSLWCIQTDPSTRPSMSKVVEMLEGKLEYLKIPPQPYLYSPARSEEQHSSAVFIS